MNTGVVEIEHNVAGKAAVMSLNRVAVSNDAVTLLYTQIQWMVSFFRYLMPRPIRRLSHDQYPALACIENPNVCSALCHRRSDNNDDDGSITRND
eukprot:1998195-Amphidinium_carterae.1